MKCPKCKLAKYTLLKAKTNLGYNQFRCKNCRKQYNERSGTPLNHLIFPTEVVMLTVHYYFRFKVSLDDVVELMSLRGIFLSHQTVHNWVQTFGVALGLQLRKARHGHAGKKWHVDATYVKISGNWCYLYRAIDKQGELVDIYLSDTRDQAAAERFFAQAINTAGIIPDQITTDKEPALYSAIANTFPKKTKHRDSKYMNNMIEQNHRGIKSRYKVMKGFKNIFCALIFCTAFEEIKQLFARKNKTRAAKRRILTSKIQTFNNLLKI